MKKVAVIILILLLVALAVKLKGSSSSPPVNNPTPYQSSLGTRESNDGSVSVSATPHSLGNTWDFDISINTHSGELSEDLVAVSELVDDQGRLYKPTVWEGAPPGGHHRQGILRFNPISPQPKSIELKIKNVGGVAERSFRWNF